jgi:DNA-binding NtrC family response regulator
MKNKSILIVDDEPSIRRALSEILELEGYDIFEAEGADSCFDVLNKEDISLILLDIKMQGKDGLEIMADLNESDSVIPVIMLSGHGTIDTAVQATKLGAFDFIEKPPDLNRILVSVRNALQRNTLQQKNKQLRRVVHKVTEIIGDSPEIELIKKTIRKVSPTDARVLITGENGTGKELVARWIHEHSQRANEQFVEVNCAAIPSDLLESELFGHEKGAFTGATKQRIGKFEAADGGTLFLDEIGDMSLEAQAKVLRALQEGTITRVGGNKSISVNVRVLAATNKDLNQEIKDGNFREDLFHRLSVIPIHVPPLRERREDIPQLAESFLERIVQKEISFSHKSFTNKALDALTRKNWSGNVRELQNVIERLVILSEGDEITEGDVDFLARPATSNDDPLNDMLCSIEDFQEFKENAEKHFLEFQLKKHQWNISHTAEHIGIQRSHLYNKINKYNIER